MKKKNKVVHLKLGDDLVIETYGGRRVIISSPRFNGYNWSYFSSKAAVVRIDLSALDIQEYKSGK
jgi:hypothetical protein